MGKPSPAIMIGIAAACCYYMPEPYTVSDFKAY